ncbi:MAG: electron transport complex subunit RsxE [Thermodesulfovibrionales bacterium]|nr:electron transport complex subunit RsxE [Thermodesulfovibrionales bacterium]
MSHEHQYSNWQLIKDGLFKENTIFRLAISLCPAIAVTNGLKNGVYMGLAVMFVQVMVNVTVSSIKNFLNPLVRIPVFMLIISGWVSVTDMVMAAYARDVYRQMGLYIQLIVAFASILVMAEMFASKNKVVPSFFNGLGSGLGFMVALVVISFFRELLGRGSLWGFEIAGGSKPLLIMLLPTGGFFAVGILMGFFNWIDIRFYGGKGAGGASGH